MKEAVVRTFIKLENNLICMSKRAKDKLSREDGVSVSKEQIIWIIVILVVGGLILGFVKKFFPEILNMVGDKIKEFFGNITITT